MLSIFVLLCLLVSATSANDHSAVSLCHCGADSDCPGSCIDFVTSTCVPFRTCDGTIYDYFRSEIDDTNRNAMWVTAYSDAACNTKIGGPWSLLRDVCDTTHPEIHERSARNHAGGYWWNYRDSSSSEKSLLLLLLLLLLFIPLLCCCCALLLCCIRRKKKGPDQTFAHFDQGVAPSMMAAPVCPAPFAVPTACAPLENCAPFAGTCAPFTQNCAPFAGTAPMTGFGY